MEFSPRQEEAAAVLKSRLNAIKNIAEVKDDIYSVMILDWLTNANKNEPGFENALQMKKLLKEDFPDLPLGDEAASQLLAAWLEFVAAYFATDGGRRKKRSKKTRKHKKRSKKTRKH